MPYKDIISNSGTGSASQQVQAVVAEVLPTLFAATKEEDSKEGVANAITSLSKYLLTRACPEGSFQEAAAVVSSILQGQAICQMTSSNAEEWEDEEEDDKEVARRIMLPRRAFTTVKNM